MSKQIETSTETDPADNCYDWKVETYTRSAWEWTVRGQNLNFPEGHMDRFFSWKFSKFPGDSAGRFDWSRAVATK